VSKHYVGLMSGTSMDGIDAVLVAIDNGSCNILATHSHPLAEGLASELRRLVAEGHEAPLGLFGRLDVAVGRAFAGAVDALLDSCGRTRDDVRAIGSHGQTVLHNPGGEHPYTLQIGDPNIIAAETGIQTVADFRRRDLALGGQGAPLAPAFHQAFFRSADEYRVVLNLGGIANVTLMPPGAIIIGFDTGPGNTLMDAWIRRHLDQPFDDNGLWAASVEMDDELLKLLMEHPFFASTAPKSTGVEDFNLPWLDKKLAELSGDLEPATVQSTLCELTAKTIAEALIGDSGKTGHLLVCGGGTHNGELLKRLAARLPGWAVGPTDDVGISADWVEAAAFAWLAHRTLEGLPGNLPEVTGARCETILGAVYAGSKL
jgi:anhydro-N-acetylmuramic acid kinase